MLELLFKDKDVNLNLPPSQPSPTGEGAKSSFPPWGKLERGFLKYKDMFSDYQNTEV